MKLQGAQRMRPPSGSELGTVVTRRPSEEAALEAELDGLEHTFETTTFKIALDPDDDMGWDVGL